LSTGGKSRVRGGAGTDRKLSHFQITPIFVGSPTNIWCATPLIFVGEPMNIHGQTDEYRGSVKVKPDNHPLYSSVNR
jgi:hypothetical protein